MHPALQTALAALAALAFARPVPAQTVYIVGGDNSFGRSDLTTRVYTQVASSLGGGGTYSPTHDGSGGLHVTRSAIPCGASTPARVSAVAAAGGTTSTHVTGLALSSGGTLYARDFVTDRLATASTAAGALTAVGPTGASEGKLFGILAFRGNTLYAASDTTDTGADAGTFRTPNAAAGDFSAPVRASNDLSVGVSLLASGPDLYGFAGAEPYRVDAASGGLTGLGAPAAANLPTGFTGAGGPSAKVPEPGCVLLAAGGALGLAARLRRRLVG